ncbi:axonemal dynein light chain domain-containing protein 1-like isoform X2 [Physella acuta]|uniref:axonemal dynein light chain domain-containing protein 1-like isoform X2 n=1 Tax=Physella acuta TaxID=109671 RepID=UPI0027DC97B2|nr:axonemal dynein light chain domain-containing protein 1-like isoform X2 [Physella acuta]
MMNSDGCLQVSVPSPTFVSQHNEDRILVLSEQTKNGILPELRSSASIDKRKPLPTSLQSDFIPEDILFALTQPPPSKNKLGPVTLTRNLNTSNGLSRPPPANVWNHKRKERLKHLVENTPCACGAGKDISFLYDVPQPKPHPTPPDRIDKSAVRKVDDPAASKPLHLPDTLIPDEYHIVKNKGVIGLQYHEDIYSTKPEDHEKHLVVFPSLKPASRFEVMQLKAALNNMLDKIGANDLETGSGPTQMHNLLELIKKEQNIYNVVFHELIRQTTVECVERGELLADLRNRYSDLLNKIPQQIMSLHEEVMAQRALDRRLTEELMRFKGTIAYLTSELTDVKEHDMTVTNEAQKAQEDLRSALAESQKNASLLAEYHELYELQRQRLERQVFMLSEEKEIWSTAAYSLALKLTEEYQLSTAKRLQLSEKGWVKMANHFTILLSDRDTDMLTKIQGFVENWRDMIEDFNITLKHREDSMKESFKKIKIGIENCGKTFQQKFIDLENGVVKKPDEEYVHSLVGIVKKWDDLIIKETEMYGGDNLLNTQDELSRIQREMEGWTDCALKVFRRHRRNDGKTHPDQENMIALNEEVEQLLSQFKHRITGENGVAALTIQFQSSLEIWEARLVSNSHGVLALQESDWGNFYQALEDWAALLKQAIDLVGTTQRDEDRRDDKPHTRVDIHNVVRKTQKWATTASNSIDSEDAKMVDQVSALHADMVKWMVQILLRLAPDKEGNSKEAGEMALLGSASIPQLTEVAKTLFEALENFSNSVTLCCNGIVMENTQRRLENNEDNADHEQKDLKRLKTECDDWIHTAKMLISELTGETIGDLFPVRMATSLSKESEASPQEDAGTMSLPEPIMVRDTKDEGLTPEKTISKVEERETTQSASLDQSEDRKQTALVEPGEAKTGEAKTGEVKTPKLDNIEILGQDANTHRLSIENEKAQALGQVPVKPEVDGAPDTKKAFEALAAVQTLQTQLISAELRAQGAEERAFQAEANIVALEEKIRALEKLIQKQQETPTPEAGPPQTQVTATPTPALTPTTTAGGKDEKSPRKSGKASSKSTKKK